MSGTQSGAIQSERQCAGTPVAYRTNLNHKGNMRGRSEKDHVYYLAESKPQAIVVYCSDSRFQRAFREFVGNELHLKEGEYIPMVISGGVASLLGAAQASQGVQVHKRPDPVFFSSGSTRFHRVILINHEDCRHYEALKIILGRYSCSTFST